MFSWISGSSPKMTGGSKCVGCEPKMTGFIPAVIPAEAGIQDKRSPYVPLDLRVKPEDDKGGETQAGPEDNNTYKRGSKIAKNNVCRC